MDNPTEDESHEPKVYCRRWAVLAVFCLLNATNAALWVSYAAIAQREMARRRAKHMSDAGSNRLSRRGGVPRLASVHHEPHPFRWLQPAILAASTELFAVDTSLINAFSLTFMFAYVPGTIIAAWGMDRFGLRPTLIAAAAGNVVCGVVRALALEMLPSSKIGAWGVSLAAQCVGAMVQPAVTNAPAKLSGIWFPARERDMATVLTAMSNPLGNAIGMFVPALLVDSPSPSQFRDLLWGEAALAAVGLVLAVLLIQSQPPTPPSASSGAREDLREESVRRFLSGAGSYLSTPSGKDLGAPLVAAPPPPAGASLVADGGATEEGGVSTLSRLWAECRALLGDRPFLLLLVAFSLGLGVFNSFVTLVAQIVAPCGYDSDAAGIFGGALIGAGLLGAGVAGFVLEATRAYTTALRVGFCVCTACVCGLLLLLQRNNGVALTVMFAVAGGAMLPLLPVTLEAACEHAFPVAEESASALLMTGGQLVGIVGVLVMPLLIPETCDSPITPFAISVVALLVVGCALILFFRVERRREAAEKRPAAVADAEAVRA